MYVHFDVPEATARRGRGLLGSRPELFLRLANESEYGHKAVVDFVNNSVNRGALAVRAKLPNPMLPEGHRLLEPGSSVHARLRVGAPHPALLVKYPGPPAGPGGASAGLRVPG
jgi:hypothetical protein